MGSFANEKLKIPLNFPHGLDRFGKTNKIGRDEILKLCTVKKQAPRDIRPSGRFFGPPNRAPAALFFCPLLAAVLTGRAKGSSSQK